MAVVGCHESLALVFGAENESAVVGLVSLRERDRICSGL